MARPDGVVIVSERFWAFAGRDGTLREGAMPQPSPAVRHVPLVRGLVRLGGSLSPLFRRSGVARPRERWLLLAAVLAPCLTFFLPSPFGLVVGIGVTLVSLALTMELWQLVQTSNRRAARTLLLPGLALQRLTTREPSLEETRVALRAVAAVLERELR